MTASVTRNAQRLALWVALPHKKSAWIRGAGKLRHLGASNHHQQALLPKNFTEPTISWEFRLP